MLQSGPNEDTEQHEDSPPHDRFAARSDADGDSRIMFDKPMGHIVACAWRGFLRRPW